MNDLRNLLPEWRSGDAPATAPFGSWTSPITAARIAAGARKLAEPLWGGESLYWLENRPAEDGRTTVMRQRPDGMVTEMVAAPLDVRSRVHEYGGGAYAVAGEAVILSNGGDDRLYRVAADGTVVALTEDAPLRYADLSPDLRRERILCVTESTPAEGEGEPRAAIVAVSLVDGTLTELVSGADFYAAPRVSPDGTRMCWLSWSHPDMPWDATELWVADLDDGGMPIDAVRVAGGPGESVFQPEWAPDGRLFFVSDRSGWWNLYRLDGSEAVALLPMEAEFGLPMWVFGMSTYGFAGPNRLICTWTRNGIWELGIVDPEDGYVERLVLPQGYVAQVRAFGNSFAFLGASWTEPPSLFRFDLQTYEMNQVASAMDEPLDSHYLSVPRGVTFPTEGGHTVQAFFYPPENGDVDGPEGELPPLMVIGHAGPTAMADSGLRLKTQFWTSRGFAVLDVNYRGSTGFGRAFREALNDRWGEADVADCLAGARAMIERGWVDPDRVVMTGGSAGGLTVLAAMAADSVVKAGASHYGVADLATLVETTHKFEKHYLDRLVAPYPERRDVYDARSPLHRVADIDVPVIFFQGDADRVVLPEQSEAMAAALRERGVPVALVMFAGEGHGYRRAETVQAALEMEWRFYGTVLGFPVPDGLPKVEIENWE